MSVFSSTLQTLCDKRGIDTAQCASEIKMRPEVIENCISGYAEPSETLLYRLSAFFDVSPSVFSESSPTVNACETSDIVEFAVAGDIELVNERIFIKRPVGVGYISRQMLCGEKKCFGLRVPDNAMAPLGITHDCLAVIANTKNVANGDIVLAAVNGAFCIRRYVKDGERAFLQPEDLSVAVIDDNFEILGKLIEIRRTYI